MTLGSLPGSEPATPDTTPPATVAVEAFTAPLKTVSWAGGTAPLSDVVRHACMGLSFATVTLYYEWSVPGSVPSCMNEQRHQISPLGTDPLTWIYQQRDDEPQVRRWFMIDELCRFVDLVAYGLGMTASELVVAYVYVEVAARASRALIQPCTMRLLIVAACVLARKTCSDEEITTHRCWGGLSYACELLDADHVVTITVRLLKLCQWKFPADVDFAQYAAHLFAAADDHTGRRVSPPSMV